MTTTADPILEAWPSGEPQGEPAAIAGRTPFQLFWERFQEDRVALVALGFIVLEILRRGLGAVDREALGHPPNAQYPNGSTPIRDADRPVPRFLFGVDPVGRDVFARVVYGRASHSRSRSSRPRCPSDSASSPACSPAFTAAPPTP